MSNPNTIRIKKPLVIGLFKENRLRIDAVKRKQNFIRNQTWPEKHIRFDIHLNRSWQYVYSKCVEQYFETNTIVWRDVLIVEPLHRVSSPLNMASPKISEMRNVSYKYHVVKHLSILDMKVSQWNHNYLVTEYKILEL